MSSRARARSMLARLASVDLEHPRLDRRRVERAFRVHCERLGLEPLPVRWVQDGEEAILAEGSEPAAWFEDWERAVEAAAESAAGSAAGSQWRLPEHWPASAWVRSEALRAAWLAAEEEAGVWGSHADAAGRLMAETAALSAEEWWFSGPAGRPAAIARWLAIWEPFVTAFEAGHWIFLLCGEEVLSVPRPALRFADGVLHCEDGPAVSWPGGAQYFFWRGIHVPAVVIEAPERLCSDEIAYEPDVAVRRAMIERFGEEQYLRERGCPVRVTQHGTLWRAELDDDEPLVMVEVQDPTPEPDGTHRRHFLRVPPQMRTPRQAVAWTFGYERAKEYAPAHET